MSDKKSMVLKIFFIYSLLNLTFVTASEVDSFRQRSMKLKDATISINRFVNEQLEDSISDANSFEGCGKERLMDAVRARLAEADVLGVGKVEKFVAKSNYVETVHTPHEKSIYQDLNLVQSFALHVYGMGTLIRVGEHFIGSDKLGHFFYDGFRYYDKAFGPRGKGEQHAHNYGQTTEKGLFGYLMTGVFSYADLSANFHGLRFWNSIFGAVKDPLTGKKVDPYFTCEKGSWVLTKKFRLEKYVDAGWDEAINCNDYKDEEIKKLVKSRIAKDTKYRACPISMNKCNALVSKYRNHKHLIIHPSCRSNSLSGNFK